MKAFGEELRQLRKEKGFSIRKLSELSGVAHSYLSQVETGKRGIPKVETLEKIAAGLDIPLEDLLVLAGYIDPEDYMRMKNEREDVEWSLAEQKQEPFALDFLLISSHPLYFQDKLLTKEEKAKIQSIIEILLKD
ncbi:helix-turn-helix domain-containing protein [Brevibacillus laterosporus]|uniref:Helix-turn-helix transcriptional regulator n=1 Tax=Brevibacillus laterosporus TaxID=1465 RepID=A0AAP3DDB8_BRELA|nr:helix-turn-helix transcriptional regulator [Brevibacillus laterosporus]MCR8978655.1 helix-turn-helix domain-containing protein [Brevibacillus laterosporus]MCZ0805811.1 helix-turn-helix transcriptional regulator [Brevibacillus laterosporus]MCZ0824423.1 helix-turn-helix transcriptional regulator [Brevibacillus laterosporus]MCZ0848327.1 helix-turn-helix transcriptional regulator [Brevibacillus laterosporus]